MGVIVLGESVRIRWCPLDDDVVAALERPDVTAQSIAALMNDETCRWGLVTGQEVTLSGKDLHDDFADDEAGSAREITITPPADLSAPTWTGPGPGRWLIFIQNAGHCWAALHEVEHVAARDIAFDWTRVALPGAAPMMLAVPRYRERSFALMHPPSPWRERQALLDQTDRLMVDPFKPSKGVGGPTYRAGVLDDGAMRWLDIAAGDYPVTATPVTALFRARLALFKRELAARGIYYEDDADETGYELRWAIEDGCVPSDFHERDVVSAYTVSGQDAPEADKDERIIALYDPEDDREDDTTWAVESRPWMPARIDVGATTLVFFANKGSTRIGDVSVDKPWAEAHLIDAAVAAGLDGEDACEPSLTAADRVRAADADLAPSIGWTAVDAADRVQRAAYVMASRGVPDAGVEARLSRLRGPIVHALLAHEALRLAADGAIDAARAAVPVLPPLAPGPFPKRAHAVIALADALADERKRGDLVAATLAAVADPLERRLARLFAEAVGGEHRDDSAALPNALDGLTLAAIEAVLGPLDPPAGDASDEDEDDRHIVPAALRRALRDRSAEAFARAWQETPAEDRERAGLWLLMEAVKAEAFDVADFLVHSGVPIAGRTVSANTALGAWGGETPLGAAIEAGSLPAVRWCLDHGADSAAAEWATEQTPNGETVDWPTPALVLAAKHGQADILHDLLALGGDPLTPIANGITPLTAAAFGGDIECARLLLAAGAEANQPLGAKTVTGGPHATTPLIYACDRGHDAMVRLLLESGADPRVPRGDGELALQLAMEKCAVATLEALIAAGVNSDGISVLHTAMLKRGADVLPVLIAGGAAIDLPAGACIVGAEPELAWTALMMAVARGDGASVGVLLGAGANPDAADGRGRTALMIAALRGDARSATLLLEAGADFRGVDEEGNTALDLAREYANPDADDDPFDPIIALLDAAERARAG